MAILNLTPDSFFDGNNNPTSQCLQNKINSFKYADIIDVGAESSRPGALPVDENVELKRLSIIKKNNFNNKILSIDSYKTNIIRFCLNNNFNLINDISGGGRDFKNIDIAKEYNVPIVIMHMQGNPLNMQDNPNYNNVLDDIICFFEKRLDYAEKIGFSKENLIFDPGIGFGKSVKDNDRILLNLDRIKNLGIKIMIGVSRKSFLSINNDLPKDRLEQSLGLLGLCVFNEVNIVRVHDVLPTYKTLRILDRIKYKN